jgi:DNA-binding transcriptional regulator LsrR (DeoR family)
MYVDLFKKSAVGEIAGLYLDAKGEQVTPDEYVRQGMRLADIQRVANSPDGAAIMIAGAHQPIAGERPRRVTTVLAALKAGAVSVLVTDPGFAGTLLDAHASELFAEDSIAF